MLFARGGRDSGWSSRRAWLGQPVLFGDPMNDKRNIISLASHGSPGRLTAELLVWLPVETDDLRLTLALLTLIGH